jgi:hypothetical protein
MTCTSSFLADFDLASRMRLGKNKAWCHMMHGQQLACCDAVNSLAFIGLQDFNVCDWWACDGHVASSLKDPLQIAGACKYCIGYFTTIKTFLMFFSKAD